MPDPPLLIVVAGPSGNGKPIRFPLEAWGVDFFNVDDRCRDLHGSYQGIAAAVREQAQSECEAFVEEHIQSRRSLRPP